MRSVSRMASYAPNLIGRRGSPAIFSALFRNELLAFEGDTGGIVRQQAPEMVRCIDVPDADAGIDIDTPEDYEGLL